MNPDSTFAKRAVVKRPTTTYKPPNIVATVVHDITGGFRELQRQMGSAVSTVKAGAQKVKDFMRGR